MVFTYAVTEQKFTDITKKNKRKFRKLDLICHDTEMTLVPNQNWGDVGYFSPPIKAVYIDDDPSLPLNYSVRRRDGHMYRGIVYAVVDKETAHRHGINLYE